MGNRPACSRAVQPYALACFMIFLGASLCGAAERGYQPRACGFDMNRNGIVGEPEDCHVCNGGLTDGDADGTTADVIYVSCATEVFSGQPQGFDHPGCGSPGDPCLTIGYAFETIADGPGDGAEDFVCFRNTCIEENLSPRSDGGGVAGTFSRAASGSQARDWQLPSDPVMLVGWDVDADGVYPPHDPDHAAVLAPPKTCPGAPNQGCPEAPILNPDDSRQRFHQKVDERAIFLVNDLSHVEMAHFTVRDYGRHTLTFNSGFFDLHYHPSGNAPTAPTEMVYVHDIEMHDLNRDSNYNSRSSAINTFSWRARYVTFENLLVANNGHWFSRGGGGNGPADYGPFRWQNISLTLDACRPPAGVSCDPSVDPGCASGGVCLADSGCEPAPSEVCTTRASTSWKMWGYYHQLEVLDSVIDANVLSHPNPVREGLPRGIDARQCTQDWTIRNNELIDFNVPIEIVPESTGSCDGKKDPDGTITRLDARPVTGIVIDRNLIRHPAPTGPYDLGIVLREGGGDFPGQMVGDVTISNNVVTSRSGLETCLLIAAGHEYTGSDPAYPPPVVPGVVRVVNNTCWGPITQAGAMLIGRPNGSNQPYLQENILLHNNVVGGMGSGAQNIIASYAPVSFDAAANVWDPDAGFRWNATSGSVDLDTWLTSTGATGSKTCSPQLLLTDGTYSNGDVRPANGDVHWLPTDLCAQDAGIDASAITTVDLDGETRPQGNGWDAGADEAAPPQASDPPLRFEGSPTGVLPHDSTSVTLALSTYHPASCDVADGSGITYGDPLRQAMTADAAGTRHSLVLTGLTAGSTVTRFVRCQNTAGLANDDDFLIAFDIEAAPVVVTSGWSFDEGSGCVALDGSGAGLDGALLPGCPAGGPLHTTGPKGGALEFDGVDDYVEVAHHPSLAFTGSFTAAAWIRPNDFGDSGYGRILAKQRYVGGFGPGYSLYVADQPTGSPAATRTICANIDTAIGCADDDALTPGVWQHVALVFDDANDAVRFYVDGQPRGGFATTVTLRSSTVPLRIGDRDDLARSFHGAMDEILVRNQALTDAEVADLSVVDLVGDGADAAWPFDEADGCLAIDANGAHDGTLSPSCVGDEPTRIAGVKGSALDFDGSNDYVEVPHHADLAFTSSLTLAAWIRPVDFGDGGYGRILAKQQYVGGFGPGYSLYLGDRPTGVPATTRSLCANIDTAIGCADDDVITMDAWQHVAVVFDDAADEVRFYVDGVQRGGFTTTITLRSSTVPLRIGDRDDLARSFHGAIDEVYAWGQALSAADIADLALLPGDPPVRSQGNPSGNLPAGSTLASLELQTHKAASCRFAETPGVNFEDMVDVFTTVDGLIHQADYPVVDDQVYRLYVRCDDGLGHVNDDDYEIAFYVGFHPSELADVVFFVESRHGFSLSHGSDLADYENFCERDLFPEGCVRRWQDQSGYVRPGRPDFIGRDFGQDDAEKPGWVTDCINGWPCVRGGSRDLSPDLGQDLSFEIEAADHVRDLPAAFSVYMLTRPVTQTANYAYFGFSGNTLFHRVADNSLDLEIAGSGQVVTGPGALVPDGAFHLIEIHRDTTDQVRLLVDGVDLTVGAPVMPGGFDFSFLFSVSRLFAMHGDMAAFLLVDGPIGSSEGAVRNYFAAAYGVPGPGGPTPPVLSQGSPTGTLPAGTTSATLTVHTHIAATCSVASQMGVPFGDGTRQLMSADASGTLHSLALNGLSDGESVDRYVRCEAGGHPNTNDYPISFQIGEVGGPVVASWPFDEAGGCTTFDAIGTHDGTMLPSCLADAPTRITGMRGGALDFDGSNDYVEVPHHADLALTSSLSIAAWIRPVDFGDSSYGRILAKQQYVGGFGPGYSLYVADRPTGSPAGVRTLCANIDTAIGCAVDDAVSVGVWQHVVLVFDDDANEVHFYVDGQSRGGFSTSVNLRSSTVPLRIGDRDDLARSFHGSIDEVQIWDRALSAAEVAGLTTLVVTTLDDTVASDGLLSLREAVTGVNDGTYPPGTIVTFDPALSGVLRLSHPVGTLHITESLEIDGDGRIEISGDADGDGLLSSADVSVFEIDLPGGLARLNGLALTGGWGHGADISTSSAGGGVFVRQGSADIDDCHFEGNRADLGGALASSDLTDVVVRNSTFVTNHGNTFAGAIVNNRGTMTIESSTFSSNTSGFNAGAIYNLVGVSMTLRECTLDNNQAAFHFGGILNTLGDLTIEGSTLSNNVADRVGGGLGMLGGNTLVTHSTLSGNQSLDPVNGGGGGVYAATAAVVTVEHTTLTGNSAAGDGGGVQVIDGTFNLSHTLFANNTATSGDDIEGSISSLGYNLFGQAVVAGSSATDLLAAVAGLGPLADNGGPTLTHLPGPSSIAIDAGDLAPVSLPTEDQRGAGFPRLLDGDSDGSVRVDIGAVEVAP